MSAKKVFVSYDHSEDVRYKYLLQAWDANTDFDFEFDQRSPDKPINSTDAGVIQSSLTKKMKESDYILVLIGEKAHTSKWMKWEIERAKQTDTNLKFAAVKIKSGNVNPSGLPSGTAIAYGFEFDKIITALNNAKRIHL